MLSVRPAAHEQRVQFVWGNPVWCVAEGSLPVRGLCAAGRSRSALAYLSLLSSEAERRSRVEGPLAVACGFRGVVRSCTRGVGKPSQYEGSPLQRLAEVADSACPFAEGGPVWPQDALAVGTWWLTREVALSNVALSMIPCSF